MVGGGDFLAYVAINPYNQDMLTPLLATKLYIPPPRSKVVLRSRLVERLNDGLRRKLTLISAAAGFGKTTLVSEWAAACDRPAAWLSLDEGDSDPIRFLTYFVAALRTVAPDVGDGVMGILQAPQQPSIEPILTILVNEISAQAGDFLLILDDYHVIDSQPVDRALAFLLKHQPPQMHLVIVTREDPQLPLSQLRARGELTELRVTDLRFTRAEAAEFLNQVMGLNLSAEHIATLETRTEGWIAGLQLAALSMHGQTDRGGFIQAFTGSHHFVLDYLIEEVLHQQPEAIQTFLLRTAILDRMCGALCDAVLGDPTASGQKTLEYLERANLFIIPLDDERRWYRYHHLFADLLRQRLQQSMASSGVDDLHARASQWYEDNGLEIEAFHHAAASHDIDRAERLIRGKGIPLHFRGSVTMVLNWLESLPPAVLNARPLLWWRYASLMLIIGLTTGVEEKLQAAEAALQNTEPDADTRDLIGQIAAARATLALTQYRPDVMLAQSRRALEYLHPNNLSSRASANWSLGFGYLMMGDRVTALQSLMESIACSRACKDIFMTIVATIGVALIQEGDNQLSQAADTYRYILQLASDQPHTIISEVHLGLARICYEWNDLDAAEQHGQQGIHLSRQYDSVIDRFVIYEVLLARVRLARGDVAGAVADIDQTMQTARQQNFVLRLPEIAAAQVVALLRLGDVTAAAQVAQAYPTPISQARIHLAQGNPAAALSILDAYRQQVEAKRWPDEQLRAMVLQALAYRAHGDKEKALLVLGDVLVMAEPGGYIRLFADEGRPMAQLLSEAAARGILPEYTARLLDAFDRDSGDSRTQVSPGVSSLVEALSPRELEILRLVAQGLSNQEISERLFLALDTVKGHNRRIYEKLQVQRRTEAVARARDLGLL